MTWRIFIDHEGTTTPVYLRSSQQGRRSVAERVMTASIVRWRRKGESIHRLFIWTEESFFQNVNAVATLQSALRDTPLLAGRPADAGFSSMFRP
jgi:hypothetical protein